MPSPIPDRGVFIPNITVDARMIKASGIGTYLSQVLPRVLRAKPDALFSILGDPSELKALAWAGLPNVRIIPFLAPIYSPRQQWEILRKIPRETDLLWVPHFDIPLFYQGRLLATVHDLFHLASPKGLPVGLLKRWYARIMFRRFMGKAEAVIAVSKFTRSETGRLLGGFDNKVHVIHQGVDPSWFRPYLPSIHKRPYLLCVGNVKPHKNLTRLIEAFGLVWKKAPHDLVIVGQKEGFRTGDGKALKAAESFGNRVHFTGLVDAGKLRRYYSNAAALVFPSLYEGFGLPPLEAMASGCPVAVSRTASLPEVCGKAALYFDPLKPVEMAECMMRLLLDHSLRKDLRRRGLARAREFSWEKCAAKTTRLIDRVLRS